MRRLVVLSLLALTLAGCGDGNEESNAEATPSTAPSTSASTAPPIETPNTDLPGPEADVKAYSDAFLTGDADAAFALRSTRCQDAIGESRFAAVVDQAGALYGEPLDFETYSENVTEDGTATVTYTYVVSGINQTDQPWVFEGSGWRYDDC